jgi:polyisoprenoid-binding protein YceI
MKKIIFFFLLITFSVIAQTKLELNSDHSQVHFAINYLLGEVKGSFDQAYGELNLSADKKIITEGKIFIRVRSLHSGHKTRDGHLLGKDFFAEKSFPLMSFSFENIVIPNLGSPVKVKGKLQIKDKLKEQELELFFLGEKLDPWNKPSYFFSLNAKVDRRHFDIVWNKNLDDKEVLIEHEVRVSASLQWQEFQNKTPSWVHMIPEGVKSENPSNRASETESEVEQKIESEVMSETEPQAQADTQTLQKKTESSWLKILSQVFVSLMGFVGCIAVAIFARTKVQSMWQEILGLLFMLAFSMALYYAFYS